jgi:hypothetical protein
MYMLIQVVLDRLVVSLDVDTCGHLSFADKLIEKSCL